MITRILLSTKNKKHYFYNFYLRRSLRIFPLYYLFLAIYYYLLPILLHTTNPPGNFYYWVYLQDFAITFNWPTDGPFHFWSLAIEEHFYLFWPVLIYFFDARKVLISVFVIILLSLVVRFLLIQSHMEVFYFTFSRMDELAVGALLALAEYSNRWGSSTVKTFKKILLFILIPTLAIWIFLSGSGSTVLQLTKFILIALAYFSLIGFVVNSSERNLIKRIFQSEPLVYLGKISYGLYVYHLACYFLFKYYIHLQSTSLQFLGYMISCIIVASISYYLFENRFLKLKEYFSYGK